MYLKVYCVFHEYFIRLVVSKATPTVSVWPSAVGIIYGEDLSSTTLSGGSTSVEVNFAYTDNTKKLQLYFDYFLVFLCRCLKLNELCFLVYGGDFSVQLPILDTVNYCNHEYK